MRRDPTFSGVRCLFLFLVALAVARAQFTPQYLPQPAGTIALAHFGFAAAISVDVNGPITSLTLPGSGTLSNSQCTVSAAGASVSAAGNTLTLELPITFAQTFAGNLIFYAAARKNTMNSGWQAVGTVAVP
jgi:hypothetical protein